MRENYTIQQETALVEKALDKPIKKSWWEQEEESYKSFFRSLFIQEDPDKSPEEKLAEEKEDLISKLKENEVMKILNIAFTVAALACTVWLASPLVMLSAGFSLFCLFFTIISIPTIIALSIGQSVNMDCIDENDYLQNQKEIYLNKIADFLVSQDDIFKLKRISSKDQVRLITGAFKMYDETITFKEEDVKKLIGPLQRILKDCESEEKLKNAAKADVPEVTKFFQEELRKSHVINDVIKNIIAREVIKEPGLLLS